MTKIFAINTNGNYLCRMQRKFLTSLLLLLFLNLLVKPIYIFGVDLRVQNLVGPDEYGIFFAMFNFSMLFNILLDLGITNYNNRNISQHHYLLNKHFSGIFTIRLALALLYAVITISIALTAGYGIRQLSLLGILIFNQFIISFVLYLRSNIAGLQLFKLDSFISVLDRLVMIILCGYLIYHPVKSAAFTIELFVVCQTIAYTTAFTIALVIVIRKSAFKRFYWNPLFAMMIIRKSFPFALLALLMVFYFRVDSVLLERILPDLTGARQSGIYASAFRLLDAFVMIPFLFAVLLLPMFSKMIMHKEDVKTIINLAFPLLLVFSVTLVVLSIGFSEDIMRVLYHDHSDESAAVFRLLIPGLIAASTSYIFGTLLTANGNLWKLNIIAATAMAMNISLNILLIPRLQAEGSAVANCSTLFFVAVMQLSISSKTFKLKPSKSVIVRFILFLITTALIIYLQRFIAATWVWRFIISGASITLFSFIIGFIKPYELVKTIMKPNKSYHSQ